LFFFGDAIVGILEDEEELNEHLKQAAHEVNVIIFCSDSKYCKKLYFLVLFIDRHGEPALAIDGLRLLF